MVQFRIAQKLILILIRNSLLLLSSFRNINYIWFCYADPFSYKQRVFQVHITVMCDQISSALEFIILQTACISSASSKQSLISLIGDDQIIPSAEFRLELEEHHRKGRRLMGILSFLVSAAMRCSLHASEVLLQQQRL